MSANLIGAFIRWAIRGFRTCFREEVSCINGWFNGIPIIEPFENIIIGLFVGLIIVIIIVLLV